MTEQFPQQRESTPNEAQGPYDKLDQNELSGLMEDALRRGSTESLMKLFDSGIDIDQTDYEGRTALMISAAQGKSDVVDILLGRGANVNRVYMYHNRKPFTALDAARQSRNGAELEELLLSHGAKSGPEAFAEQSDNDQ